jgi:hypothetical protein
MSAPRKRGDSRAIRVELAPTTRTDLVCIACGLFQTEYEIVVPGLEGDPQAGCHTHCLAAVHSPAHGGRGRTDDHVGKGRVARETVELVEEES